MNVLALVTITHDGSATLISQNKVYAVEIERISRIKYNCDQNRLTYAYTTNQLGKLNIKSKPDGIKDKIISYLLDCANIDFSDINIGRDEILNKTKESFLTEKYTHHKNHAASAFYPSEFKQAAILVIDVFGSVKENDCDMRETVSFWFGKQRKIQNIETFYSPAYQFNNKISPNYEYHNSLGVFYMDLTLHCGFKVLEGGKTMGLSAYGTDKILKRLKKYIKVNKKDGKIKFKREYNKFLSHIKESYKDQFNFKADVAFAAQKILEECVLFYCNRLFEITKCKKICLAGGVALNSVANGLIVKKTEFEEIFIQPASKDSGQSLGKALNYFYEKKSNHLVDLDYNNFCLGKEYNYTSQINQLKNSNLVNVKTIPNLEKLVKITAELLKKDKIIAWFQGRSEFGPRALGNRSILCNPCSKAMVKKLNNNIKFREWFRPFAPVVLEEFVQEYFEIKTASPHMLLVAPVKNKKIPAVTHVDNTSRIQTVNIKQNKKLSMLIKQFYEITNIPVLLNTSFNIKGEPIVETPQDAVRTFLDSKIDFLILGNNIISKK
ncbi:MAG: hypothetical protein MAG795_00280 [Candidatus Woesearchaeota archaeon]|nr:hypothetical protein [Candidatus Woesearchaeota archaeon]